MVQALGLILDIGKGKAERRALAQQRREERVARQRDNEAAGEEQAEAEAGLGPVARRGRRSLMSALPRLGTKATVGN